MIIVGWLKNSGLSYPQFEQTIADATVNDILSDLPALQPGGKSGEYRSDDFSDYLRSTGIRKDSDILTHHCARPNKDRDIEIYRRTIELWNDGHKRLNYNDLPDELKTHKNRKSFLDRFKVVEGDEAYCHTCWLISQKMDITLFIRILSNTVRLRSGRPLASNRFRMIISLKARERLNLYR